MRDMPVHRPDDHDHDHHLGLEHDLAVIAQRRREQRLQQRRQALLWLASGGAAAALVACGGSDGSTDTASTSSTSLATSSASTASTTTASSTTAGSCIVDPQETNGPFPSDGSNSANGTVSDILKDSGIVRSNIRSSFGTSTTTAPGVPLVLTLNLVNVATSCSVLTNYAIYIWHCNAAGEYSLYASDLLNENYLRGVQ